MIFETLNSVSSSDNVQISYGADGFMRLSGVFGVCGVRNRNERVYEYNNYKKCIDQLNVIIERDGGVAGEMEHPVDLNMHMENISHKVEALSIDENGVISGRICLLNTPKGLIAQEIVKGGLPLYISSRGFGDEDSNGNVKLEGIVTYDLVGTPGFEQAKLTLTEARKCLTESRSIFGGASSSCIVRLDEELQETEPVEVNQDLNTLITTAIADALNKAQTENSIDMSQVVTINLLEGYISDVVKTYIDECIDSLSESLGDDIDNLNARIDIMKEKLLHKMDDVKTSVKQPNVTRHRVYVHQA